MAVDEVLLADAAENGIATLRFYQWSEPTLSLGYFQRYEDRHQHEPSRACAVVRRQTGGGAILHDRELTYSLTLPAEHPLARQTEILYSTVHDVFIASLARAIENRQSAWHLMRLTQESNLPARDEPFLCFQRRALGDVLVLPKWTANRKDATADHRPSTGAKVLGSAQRRHRGAVLQHGSLLVETSSAAPELTGLSDLIDLNVNLCALRESVSRALEDAINLGFVPAELPPDRESMAWELANKKYGSKAWTERR